MSKFENVFETDTLQMSRGLMDKGENTGYWLYDKTRGMNLGMRAGSEREAFIEALEYYQERLEEVTTKKNLLEGRVNSFIEGLKEIDFLQDE